MARIGLELGAQVTDVNANRFNIVIGIVAPHLFKDFTGGYRLAVALHQAMQQLKLKVGEAYRVAKPDRLKTLGDEG